MPKAIEKCVIFYHTKRLKATKKQQQTQASNFKVQKLLKTRGFFKQWELCSKGFLCLQIVMYKSFPLFSTSFFFILKIIPENF